MGPPPDSEDLPYLASHMGIPTSVFSIATFRQMLPGTLFRHHDQWYLKTHDAAAGRPEMKTGIAVALTGSNAGQFDWDGRVPGFQFLSLPPGSWRTEIETGSLKRGHQPPLLALAFNQAAEPAVLCRNEGDFTWGGLNGENHNATMTDSGQVPWAGEWRVVAVDAQGVVSGALFSVSSQQFEASL